MHKNEKRTYNACKTTIFYWWTYKICDILVFGCGEAFFAGCQRFLLSTIVQYKLNTPVREFLRNVFAKGQKTPTNKKVALNNFS